MVIFKYLRLKWSSKKIWHPFDYPPEDNCTENDPFDPGGRQIRIYNIESTDNITTDSIFKYDTSTVRWETSTVPYQRVIGEEYSLISPYYNSYGSLSTRVVGKSDIPVSRGSRSDTIIIPDTSIVFHKDYITTFKYIKDSDDALHNCDNLDSAYLRVQYIPQETDQYLILKVVTNKFDMEKRYILDAPLIKLLNNVPSNPPPEGNRLPELKINLIPIIDSINTMNNGDTLVFKFESVTIGGAINIVDGAEDLGPTIIVVCDDCTHNDYTFAYLYNDSSRTTNYFAKIDDGLHTTSKGWVKTYDILDGRYTESIGFFGADNRFLKLDTKIGTPPSPSRIDSIIMKLSGAGKTIQMKDQDGYISKIIWRDCIPNTFTSPDNTNILVNKKVLSPNTYTNLLNVSADEYFGVCYESTTTDEAGIKNSSYYDAFGNLRRTIYDVDDKKVTTSFTYDKSGNLKFVIHPNNDTTKYWYDNFGRLKYKFNKDVDYSSNSYNKIGQIRFSQTKEQVDSCKLAYYEYDDLGRITIVGEAKVDTIGLFLHEPQIINDTLCLFNRLTDLLDPDILHYSYFNDPNFGDEGLLTANMTLYSNYTRQVPTFWNSYNIKVCIPYYTEIPYDTCPVPPFIVHPTQNYEPLDTIASIIDFENIANFPDFVRTAISYDKLPANSGSIWSNIPPDSNWQNMSPFDTLRNLKGRQVATAYRNHSGEPFHFVVFSYDPRGRIEAVLRYTENLGYDAVYYTYNSMNQILSVMVSDPIRTYKTWYGYDDNGRLDSVWTKLCNVGSGLGINIKPKFPDTTLFQIIRPDTADIVYKYNYRGMVEQIEYLPVNVVQHLNYSSRGWLDSMIALRNYDTLFNQVLEHNNTGNITKQKSKQYNQNEIIQEYNYDKLERLQNWTHGGITDNFSYDVMGNRLGHRKTDSVQFSYSASLPNRLLTTLNQTSNKLTTYNYNSIGGVKMIDSWNGVDSTKEAIYYTMEGLPNKYLKWEYGTQFQSVGEHEECAGSPTYDPAKWDWRYRYSILGGREQKRLYYSPHGDSCFGYNHPWAYYLRGAGGEQLAVYYGRQTAADTCNGTGRRVYIYPNSYITNGGELVTIPESIIQNPYGYRKEFSISDHLGSVRTIVTVSNGNVSVKGYEYQPYGEILSGTPGDDARIGFTAQERDRESSFFLMGARHYDPEIGRFLSTDPLMEFFSDQSPYSYAYNSPLIWNDPTGLFSEIAELDDYYVEIMEWTMVWGETGNDNPLAPGWGWIMQPIKRKVKIGGSGGTRGGSPQGRRGAGSYAGTASYSTNKLPKGGNYTNNNRKKQLLWDDDLVQGSTLSQHNPSFFENVRNYGVNSSWWNPIGLGINTLDDINVTVTNLTNRITMSDKPALHMDGTFATNQEIRESSVNTMVFFATLAGPKLFGNLQGSLAQKIYSIYQGIDREGIVRYIGLTGRDPTIRFMEQLGSKTEKALLDYSVILTKPTYTEGRIWEQIFINKYGLQKNGGPLLNKYNSISPKYWYQFGIK
ncbi:MAG: RHS repeat-associated core domain-containing protein [Ignavibacteriae bacterium]|nr:RHS repeat-associated core domain-containing protein [Ignavibacteriota bacterium]